MLEFLYFGVLILAKNKKNNEETRTGEKGRHARKQKQKKQLAICNCFLISINEKLEVHISYFSLFLLFFLWFLVSSMFLCFFSDN